MGGLGRGRGLLGHERETSGSRPIVRGPDRPDYGRPVPVAPDSAAARLDVATVGNALVDVLAPVDEDMIAELGLVKGTTALVDLTEAERLYAATQPIVEVAGGSAANTAVGAASLGSRTTFVGKLAEDRLGRLFDTDIRAAGVDFATTVATDGTMTGRCLSLVTPDAERTMCTYLGAAAQLRSEDVDPAHLQRARITYLEGYLWDMPDADRMLGQVMAQAHQSGGVVALSLSDPFCVERHGEAFGKLLGDQVDLLFANEAEITLLLGVDDIDAAAEAIRPLGILAALTRGAKGSTVV